jgi:tetratricopeptide (TPR) repeat protein
MGSVYYIVDDSKKALPYFEKAFQLDDSDAETLRLKTNVHLALEQKDDAIDCCYRILKIEPKNSEATKLIKELESL